MKLLLPLFSAIIVLSGCSLPVKNNFDPFAPNQEQERGAVTELWNITIERYEERQFTGLLGVKEGEHDLRFVLLDSTGISLLEGRRENTGKKTLDKITGPLSSSRLGELLLEALTRIFLLEPKALPCANNGLLSFCVSDARDGTHKKEVLFGPLLYWQVTSERDAGLFVQAPNRLSQSHSQEFVDEDSRNYKIHRYRQPWIGVTIALRSQVQ